LYHYIDVPETEIPSFKIGPILGFVRSLGPGLRLGQEKNFGGEGILDQAS
jgi:hypothetical protein